MSPAALVEDEAAAEDEEDEDVERIANATLTTSPGVGHKHVAQLSQEKAK